MNKREAQVFTAHTGLLFGEFSWFHRYAEEVLERPVWTHELSNSDIWEELKVLSKEEFMEINEKAILVDDAE